MLNEYMTILIQHTGVYASVSVTGRWGRGGRGGLPEHLLGSEETHQAENTGRQTDASLCSSGLTWPHQSNQSTGRQGVGFSFCGSLQNKNTAHNVGRKYVWTEQHKHLKKTNLTFTFLLDQPNDSSSIVPYWWVIYCSCCSSFYYPTITKTQLCSDSGAPGQWKIYFYFVKHYRASGLMRQTQLLSNHLLCAVRAHAHTWVTSNCYFKRRWSSSSCNRWSSAVYFSIAFKTEQQQLSESHFYYQWDLYVKLNYSMLPSHFLVSLCRGMTRWGEYVDLHHIDEMSETPQETAVNNHPPGCFYFPFISPSFARNSFPQRVLTFVSHCRSSQESN